MAKRSHDVNEKLYFWCEFCLFLVAASFLMSLEIYCVIFEEIICFFLLLITLLERFNLSILRISSHFEREFLVNTKNVVVFSLVLCGANETPEFPLCERSSSSMLFLVEVKYRAEISLKMTKIG